VKAVKGFGKNYFSLSAILAYSASRTLESKIQALTSLDYFFYSKDEFKENESSIRTLDLFSNEFKPCLCSCFFNHLAHIMLHIHHYIPRCPYYTTYFAFRRTGVHPPRLSFS